MLGQGKILPSGGLPDDLIVRGEVERIFKCGAPLVSPVSLPSVLVSLSAVSVVLLLLLRGEESIKACSMMGCQGRSGESMLKSQNCRCCLCASERLGHISLRVARVWNALSQSSSSPGTYSKSSSSGV